MFQYSLMVFFFFFIFKFIQLPNILGFVFGVLQMVLYVIYKNYKTDIDDHKLPETKADVVNLSTTVTSEVQVCSQPNPVENG
jgi:solute carrier family 50 protein (sugar transporter)